MRNNDYSKFFAMLRPVRAGLEGMAGFARIEIKAGKGRMNLNVQGFKKSDDEKLIAALVGNDGAFAHECGELFPGSRGQASLMFEFDPESIGGVSIDDYTAAVIISKSGEGFRPLIAGVFGKTGVSDWDAAAASLGRPPVQEMRGRPMPEKEEKSEKPAEIAWVNNVKPAPEAILPPEGFGKSGKKRIVDEKGRLIEIELDELQNPDELEEAEGESVFDEGEYVSSVDKPVRLCVQDLVWQGYAFAMKQLFEKYPEVEPFGAMGNMIFVKVGLPVKSAGADHYILGAHAEGDEVDLICVGVPGTGGAVPPAGLEGASWKKSANGRGYWLSWQDAYMGYPVKYDLDKK